MPSMREIIDICNRHEYPFDVTTTLRHLIARIRATSPQTDTDISFATDAMKSAYKMIESKFHGNTIPIFRAITAPDNWVPDTDRFGIYWTWDRDLAHPYMGDKSGNEVTWLIAASATRDQIDWSSTIIANAIPAYRDEREITINDDASIEIISIERHN